MKTENEVRSAMSRYAERYLLTSCEGDTIFTQAYETGLAPVSQGGYFLADRGMSSEDVLTQAAEIDSIEELPEPVEDWRESTIEEYWIHQLAGIFYDVACEMANEKYGEGKWTEETLPEFGGWNHIILVADKPVEK